VRQGFAIKRDHLVHLAERALGSGIGIKRVGEEIDIVDLGGIDLHRGADGGHCRLIFGRGGGIVARLQRGLAGGEIGHRLVKGVDLFGGHLAGGGGSGGCRGILCQGRCGEGGKGKKGRNQKAGLQGQGLPGR